VLSEVACLIASVIALCWSMAAHPRRARCPAGWYVNGIRATGEFECVRTPGGDVLYDGAGGYPDRAVDLPGRLSGRIYCTSGSLPIVVSDHAVGCMR
jgi:hypothetical protein